MANTIASQIEVDDHGVAWIAGANTKVVEVVLDKKAHGWSAEEIHFQHPHLALSQIHSALAYYYQNREELDEQIEHDYREAKRLEPTITDAALLQKLRAAKQSK
jgi:uncharacterized protein (DUF433 family)